MAICDYAGVGTQGGVGFRWQQREALYVAGIHLNVKVRNGLELEGLGAINIATDILGWVTH